MDESAEIPLDCSSSLGHSRTIVHIDADCFYAQVEMLRNPQLKEKALGIQQKNIVVTCNYKAREFGVGKLMYITEAMKLCPELVLVSGEDLTHYRAMSDKVTDLLQTTFSPRVERLGMDENFVDITHLVQNVSPHEQKEVEGCVYKCENDESLDCHCGCDLRVKAGSHIASTMRKTIFEELGLTVCAGVSYNKVLAKIVGSQNKPNQQTTLFSWQATHLIMSLQGVKNIPGIGRQTADLLKSRSICTISDLQSSNLSQLTSILGGREKAKTVWGLSFGIDDSPVKQSGKPKSMGIEDAFKEIKTVQQAEEKIKILATRLLQLMISQEEKRQPGTLKLTIRNILKHKDWKRESRQMPIFALPSIQSKNFVISSIQKLMPCLMELFHKIVLPGESFHLTLLGVAFVNFSELKTGAGSLNAFLQPVTKKCKQEDTLNKIVLPPNVDPEVFSALPPDVQEEILQGWRTESSTSSLPTVKKKQSIKDYFASK